MIWITGVQFSGFPQAPSRLLDNLTKLAILLLATAAVGSTQTPSLDRISCVHTTYNYAGTDTCRAFLTATTSTHLYIALKSSDPAVTVPSGVTVSLKAASKGFTANIASVSTARTAIITATLGGISKSFKISLVPATTNAAAMSVNAGSIGFGSVALNTLVAQSVTVTSTGTAPLTVNSATSSGTGFSISGATFPATLNPGQSLTLQVQFDPTSAIAYTGKLTIGSSISTSIIPLSGTGAAQAVEVGLSWNATSSGDPIVGYNVYRALSGSSSYSRLNAGVEAATTYTDGTVQSGSIYNYIVKSVDSMGAESAPSNTAIVTIP